jgi:hypothetical protein
MPEGTMKPKKKIEIHTKLCADRESSSIGHKVVYGYRLNNHEDWKGDSLRRETLVGVRAPFAGIGRNNK